MPVDRSVGNDLATTLLDMYADAERRLVADIARHLAAGDPDAPAPEWATRKLAAVRDLRRRTQVLLERLAADTTGQVEQALMLAYMRGGRAALDELARQQLTPLERLSLGNRVDLLSRLADLVLRRRASLAQVIAQARADLPGIDALQRLAFGLATQVQATHFRILRWATDVYREVVGKASAAVLLGTQTRLQVAQSAWDQLLSRGVTGFVDQSGRHWQLASYVEMATRTTTAHAAVQGHLDRLGDLDLDLVIVSDAPQECHLCRPWEAKVLAREGVAGARDVRARNPVTGQLVTVHVAGTVAEAIAAGLHHPNAILGNQRCRVLGDVENAVRAWYEGPSVHLTTAGGNRLTVSPNHPVLTTAGWLAAERVHEGMYVLSTARGSGEGSAADAEEDLHDAPASFEKVFDALVAHGCRTSITATSHDFHGDGRSYKGEIDVVWAEGALLDVLQPLGIKQLGERGLMRSSVELHAFAGDGALLSGGQAVRGSVGGALSYLDLTCFEPAPERRLAGAEELGEILAGLPCEVAPDQVVSVERDWYRGHAYDLQTSTGAYLTADIVVHNCRHSLSAYLPGVTKVPTGTEDPEGDLARQRQRELERGIRHWKLREAGAITLEAKTAAGVKVRAWQAQLREHLAAHPELRRLRHREQIGTAR